MGTVKPGPIGEPTPAVRVVERRPAIGGHDWHDIAPVVYDQGTAVVLTPADLAALLALITRTKSSQPNPLQLDAIRDKLRALIAGGGL